MKKSNFANEFFNYLLAGRLADGKQYIEEFTEGATTLLLLVKSPVPLERPVTRSKRFSV